jgi:hypothetical protein
MTTLMSWDNTVVTATGYRPDRQEVGVSVLIKAIFFSSHCSDWFWGTPSLLSNGYQRLSWG